MKKIIGQQSRLMGMEYKRVMPQSQLQTVGAFFLLDHFYERHFEPQDKIMQRSTGAHPHRGITTLTYVLKGSNEHIDSLGNHAIVNSGSVHWMKSGRGIVHNEGAPVEFQKQGGDFHLMQFWILLSDDEREDNPEYQPLVATDIPEKTLDDDGSLLRVLLGEYCSAKSPLPNGDGQFLYHLMLSPGQAFYFTKPRGEDLAILAAKGSLKVDKEMLKQSELLVFSGNECTLALINEEAEAVDVMLFGGQPYNESYYSSGPFVMKDYEGIVRAYQDYNVGEYGEIKNNN